MSSVHFFHSSGPSGAGRPAERRDGRGISGRPAAIDSCGAGLWRRLLAIADAGPLMPRCSRSCPSEPWVAAVLLRGIQVYPVVAGWVGDFERRIAWAWLETVSGESR